MYFDPNLFFASMGTAGTQAVNAGAAQAAATGAGMAAPAAGAAMYPAAAQPGMMAQAGAWLSNPDNMMALAGAMQGLGSILSVGNPKAEAISGLAGQQLQQAAGANALNSMQQKGIQPPAAQPTALTQPVAGGVAQSQAVAAQPQASALQQPVAGSYLAGNPTMGTGPTAIGSVPFPKISMYMSPEMQANAVKTYIAMQGQTLGAAQVAEMQKRTALDAQDFELKRSLSPSPEEAATMRQADLEYKKSETQVNKDRPALQEDQQAHEADIAQRRFDLNMLEASRKLELDKQFETFKLDLADKKQQQLAGKTLTALDKAKLIENYVERRSKLVEFGADDPITQQNLRLLDDSMRQVIPDLDTQLAPPTREAMRAQLQAARPNATPEALDKALDQWFPKTTAGGESSDVEGAKDLGKKPPAKDEEKSAVKAPQLSKKSLAEDKTAQSFARLKAKFPRVPDATIQYAISRTAKPKVKWEAFPALGSVKAPPLPPEQAAEEYLRSVAGQFK